MAGRDPPWGLFADLLEYPRADVVETARQCQSLVAPVSPEAGQRLAEFGAFAAPLPLGKLQEVFIGIFDLEAAWSPYVGYHILGESYKRSAFLVGLKERYAACGFTPARNELPDHLAVLLRFLSVCREEEVTKVIVEEALIPAIDRMTGKVASEGYEEGSSPSRGQHDHPYRGVLEAVRLALMATRGASDAEAAASGGGARA